MTNTLTPKKKQKLMRFDEILLKNLSIQAKSENRTLNNYIETELYKVVRIPNPETLEALKEVHEDVDTLEETTAKDIFNDL